MTDDIVTRLREWAKPTVTQDDILDLRQAADEIERLRHRLAKAEQHLRIVSETRGSNAANRILDYWMSEEAIAQRNMA